LFFSSSLVKKYCSFLLTVVSYGIEVLKKHRFFPSILGLRRAAKFLSGANSTQANPGVSVTQARFLIVVAWVFCCCKATEFEALFLLYLLLRINHACCRPSFNEGCCCLIEIQNI